MRIFLNAKGATPDVDRSDTPDAICLGGADFYCVWTAAIGLRLVWLQVVRHQQYVETAAKQQQRTFEVAPRRGVLYDRNLRELAMTVLVDSVYAVPSELGENRGNAAEMLAKMVHSDPRDNFTSKQQMLARFNASRNFAWVAQASGCGDGDAGARAESEGRLSAEGVQAVLSEQRSGRAGAGVCGHGR